MGYQKTNPRCRGAPYVRIMSLDLDQNQLLHELETQFAGATMEHLWRSIRMYTSIIDIQSFAFNVLSDHNGPHLVLGVVQPELEHDCVGVVVPGHGFVAGGPHSLTGHRARENNLRM